MKLTIYLMNKIEMKQVDKNNFEIQCELPELIGSTASVLRFTGNSKPAVNQAVEAVLSILSKS